MSNETPQNTHPVLVVGSVAFDTIHTTFDKRERLLGGSASYASFASSYFAPTRLVGIVGTDFGDDHIDRFSGMGIDLDGLQRSDSGKTFFWEGRYEENFHSCHTLDIELNVFEGFHPHLPDSYRSTPFVVLGNIQPDLQMHVLDQMRNKAFVAADTRDLWIETARNDLTRLVSRIDLFLLNDDEAALMTDEANVIRAGRALLKMGPKMVVIKKGAHGSVLFYDDHLFMLPAYPVTDLRDPTGAGDSYLGAMIGFLAAEGGTDLPRLKKSLVYATAAASITVESFGCDHLERAGRAEIDARYRRLLEISQL